MGLLKKIFKPVHIVHAANLEREAVDLINQNRLDEAEKILDQARQIVINNAGADDPDLPPVLINLATLYSFQGRFEDSERSLLEALRIWEKSLGKEHEEILLVLNELASLYSNFGVYQNEEMILKRMLQQQENQKADTNLLDTLTSLAHNLSIQEKYEDALPFAEKAVDLCENFLGHKQDAVLGGALSILGDVYQGLDRREESEKTLLLSLKMLEESVGDQAINLMPVLNNLGHIYQVNNNYEDAEKYFERLKKLCEEVLGKDHALYIDSLTNLGNLYAAKGDESKAKMYADLVKSISNEKQ